MTPGDVLISELKALHRSFDRDELAYLALTSKPEFVVRDRLAFRLHQRLESSGYLVAREWNHRDLAILRRCEPVLLLELKAMYSFDAVKASNLREFHEAVESDRKKAIGQAGQAEVYALLLVTHPQARCGPDLDCVVKYRRGIERAAAQGIPEVRELAKEAIAKIFRGEPIALNDGLVAGSAFGIPVSVDYWLFGPYGGAA